MLHQPYDGAAVERLTSRNCNRRWSASDVRGARE